MEKLQEHGIQLRNWGQGDHKALCPQCSHTRKNKRDQCLSVTIQPDGGAVWKCHNCEWTGGVRGEDYKSSYIPPKIKKRPSVRLVEPANIQISKEAMSWFGKRGISEKIFEYFGIF